MLEKLKRFSTIIYLKILSRKFKKIVIYHYKNYKQPIFVFSAKDNQGAQCTIFNTIIIQDIYFEKYSKKFRDFIFLHELGHLKTNYLLRLIFTILAIPALFLFFTSPPIIILYLLIFLYKGYSLYFILYSSVIFLLAFFIISSFVMILNWPLEGYAELFAIKNMGLENYESCLEEERNKKVKRNIISKCFWRYFNFIRYPPKRLIFWSYRRGK